MLQSMSPNSEQDTRSSSLSPSSQYYEDGIEASSATESPNLKHELRIQEQTILTHMEDVWIKTLEDFVAAGSRSASTCIYILHVWRVALSLLSTEYPIDKTPSLSKIRNLRLPTKKLDADGLSDIVELINPVLDEYAASLLKLWEAHPAPPDFAKPEIWPKEQKKSNALLCLRPAGKAGLPLCTLHKVFSEFLVEAETPVPDTAFNALRAASALCDCMGESFDNEARRSEAFDNCVKDLFPGWSADCCLRSSRDITTGKPCRVLLLAEGVPGVIREDKWEPGQTGSDIYLQNARNYELAVNALKDLRDNGDRAAIGFLSHGAPMFLVSILGPILIVAGGFHDGESIIVEPLGQMSFMLEDISGKRQQILARLLYALYNGIQTLRCLLQPWGGASFPPGTPRLYPKCYSTQSPHGNPIATLTFQDTLPNVSASRPLFAAKLIYPDTTVVKAMVKLVAGYYGADAHHALANHGLAPILYGCACIEGGPTAYVMERLYSSWITLFDFGKLPGLYAKYRHDVCTALAFLLDVMEEEGVVHGDLRSNNILIDVDAILSSGGPARLKVIDFDWAGKAGAVRYPAERNEEIRDIVWPGPVGSAIEAGHDRQLVESWLQNFLM